MDCCKLQGVEGDSSSEASEFVDSTQLINIEDTDVVTKDMNAEFLMESWANMAEDKDKSTGEGISENDVEQFQLVVPKRKREKKKVKS